MPVILTRLTAPTKIGFIFTKAGKSTIAGRVVHSPTYVTTTKQASLAPHMQATDLARTPNKIYTWPTFSYQRTKHQSLAPFRLSWAAQATEASLARLSPTTKQPLNFYTYLIPFIYKIKIHN